MREDPRRNAEHQVRLALVLLFGPAVAAMLLSYCAFTHFLAPYGLDLWTKFIAAVTAAVIGIIYWLSFSILLGVVAFLPRQDRKNIMPIVWVMMCFILAASAYPNVEFMAGGYANDFEDKLYVETVVGRAEEKAAQVEKLGAQLEPAMREPAITIRAMAKNEQGGSASGVVSDSGRVGPVAGWVDTYAERFEHLAAEIGTAKLKAAEVKRRIQNSAKKMRDALSKSEGGPAERRAAMQAEADELRTAVIELSQMMPLTMLANFAVSLKGAQVKPSLSANEGIRARQEAAIAGITAEFRQRGDQIERTLSGLAAPDDGLIPAYMPSPTPILVIKHALKLINVIAAALAIDLLPLAIFLIIARVNDAFRRVPEDAVKSLTVDELLDAEKAKTLLKAEQLRRENGLIDKTPRTQWIDRGDAGRDAR